MMNKGFSLIEVVFAAAILSLVCVFLVSLFVKSNEVNERSENVSLAAIAASGITEAFRAGEYVPLVTNYGENWEITDGTPRFAVYAEASEANERPFKLIADFSPEGITYHPENGGKIKFIRVYAVDLADGTVLAEYNASKYGDNTK
ncbi:hypothetical protein FACS189490_09190 [Clostridia bacterium]|nr:hypothetical protein FACS189490_09190 [Clostridia bacterium]